MHVPAYRRRSGANIVIGDGHDRDVVQQRQRDDHDRGQRLDVEEHARKHHHQHDRDGHCDTVEDIAVDALKDLPRFYDSVDDRRQARRGEHQSGRAAGRIRRAADGDAAIGLFERGGVVHAVAGHGDDVAQFLQAFHDLVFVLREDAPESVCALHRPRLIQRNVVGLGLLGEDVACHQQVRAEAKLLGNLAADRDVVAGDHLDRKAEAFGLRDRRLRIGPRRVLQRSSPSNAQLCPSSDELATPSAR